MNKGLSIFKYLDPLYSLSYDEDAKDVRLAILHLTEVLAVLVIAL